MYAFPGLPKPVEINLLQQSPMLYLGSLGDETSVQPSILLAYAEDPRVLTFFRRQSNDAVHHFFLVQLLQELPCMHLQYAATFNRTVSLCLDVGKRMTMLASSVNFHLLTLRRPRLCFLIIIYFLRD